MERTEFREEFFAEARVDPYAHMITKMMTDMWAEGYREALCDNGVQETRPFSYRRKQATEWLTSVEEQARAQMFIAMSEIGRRLAKLSS